METIDEEVTEAALDFWRRRTRTDKPFFLWWNSTRMHIFTHLKPEAEGKTGLGIYADGMVEHDAHVGQLLDKLKELGIEDNTIVMYSTDNGAETFTWPDGGTTPFRGEKNDELGRRLSRARAIRWPGVIKPGTIINDIFAHEDMMTTLLAAAGDPDVKEQLLKGMTVGEKIQGASRRLQHQRPAGGQGREPAQGILLLDKAELQRHGVLAPRALDRMFATLDRSRDGFGPAQSVEESPPSEASERMTPPWAMSFISRSAR